MTAADLPSPNKFGDDCRLNEAAKFRFIKIGSELF
jgi:hypothetical protein